MAVKSREYALPALPAKSELGAHYYIPNGVGNNVSHYIGIADGLYREVGYGITGGVGAVNVYNETPSGIENGINKVFTTSLPFESGTTRLYLNGIRLKLGADYTETGANQITYVEAPYSSDNIIIDYQIT